MGGEWAVERILRFEPDDFVKDGIAHFGFHLRDGRYCAIDHPGHRLALLDGDTTLWTLAEGLEFPMYADLHPDGGLVVSNFLTARLLRVVEGHAELLVDGKAVGMTDMGNCVVGEDGTIWVNEVRGCCVRRFAPDGTLLDTIRDGFGWIYDIRRGPAGTIVVLDSGNFALREIGADGRTVRTIVPPGTFGSDPSAEFDGPISLAVDESGTMYVGDRWNHRLCAVTADGDVSPIPLDVPLPAISSLDYDRGRIYLPTDLDDGAGVLAILARR